MFVRSCNLIAFAVRNLVIGALLLSTMHPAAAQGRRVALVIGNAAYRSVPPLTNPGNDARLVARTLGALGFELIGGGPQVDLDKSSFDKAVQLFGQSLPGAEVALFYYSGHGLQVRGENWLVPLDANLTRVQDLDFQMLDAALVLRQMEDAGTKLNIMILDACRNNPFGDRGLRGIESGLAQMRAPEGTLISYATQPGNTASDGSGRNSPYTQALTDAMRQPGLDVLRMFNRVGVEVKKATGGQQQPWVSSSPIDGDYFLGGAGSGAATAAASGPVVQPPLSQSASSQPMAPLPRQAQSPSSDSTENLVGTWRFADGADCSVNHMGIVNVRDGRVYFEWRRASGPANLAVERIDKVDGNEIYTTVESDRNTTNPETGHKMRYMVTPNSWTSENLVTGRAYVHRRC